MIVAACRLLACNPFRFIYSHPTPPRGCSEKGFLQFNFLCQLLGFPRLFLGLESFLLGNNFIPVRNGSQVCDAELTQKLFVIGVSFRAGAFLNGRVVSKNGVQVHGQGGNARLFRVKKRLGPKFQNSLQIPGCVRFRPIALQLLNYQVVQDHFTLGALQNLLLNGPRGNESKYLHRLFLAYSVRPGHGLQIILRVPVRIVNYDTVRCGQIDPQTTSPRRQQEHEILRTWRIERRNCQMARHRSRGTV